MLISRVSRAWRYRTTWEIESGVCVCKLTGSVSSTLVLLQVMHSCSPLLSDLNPARITGRGYRTQQQVWTMSGWDMWCADQWYEQEGEYLQCSTSTSVYWHSIASSGVYLRLKKQRESKWWAKYTRDRREIKRVTSTHQSFKQFPEPSNLHFNICTRNTTIMHWTAPHCRHNSHGHRSGLSAVRTRVTHRLASASPGEGGEPGMDVLWESFTCAHKSSGSVDNSPVTNLPGRLVWWESWQQHQHTVCPAAMLGQPPGAGVSVACCLLLQQRQQLLLQCHHWLIASYQAEPQERERGLESEHTILTAEVSCIILSWSIVSPYKYRITWDWIHISSFVLLPFLEPLLLSGTPTWWPPQQDPLPACAAL